jgi:methionine synthase II (cobalamin-independent)
MNVQYSEGFPGMVATAERIYTDTADSNLDTSMEQLYTAFLGDDAGEYSIGEDYAAGLYQMMASGITPLLAKGQVTGPVTFGLCVTDDTKKSIIYDDMLGDALPKFIRLKARWQEEVLGKISGNTIIFIDEPYMVSFGSATLPLSREKVIGLLDEVFQGLHGLTGVHCCGNTDWSVLLATSTDVISYDTYNFAESLSLYPDEVKKFLARGGAIAWGIVPNTEGAVLKETVASLRDRLEEAMAPFTRLGVPFKQLVEQGLLTPSCGLPSLSEEMAERVLELLAELSEEVRSKYT